MSTFKLHTLASAPAGALPILEAANKGLGFIPNFYAQLAEAPPALQAYKQIGALLEQSSLPPEEQQVVLITVSVANHCEYCVAAHSFLARNMVKVPADVISALRDGLPLTNAKLNALALFTRAVVQKRGQLAGTQVLRQFFAAGYTPQHALEVVLGIAMKTLSNYANNLIDTPLDGAFAGEAWEATREEACCAH